jgi:selenocysteine-specific elongation factor
MIIATAGHIDHGKTLLVKSLTGVDTDRLVEEKARGISIDLGFAYWPTPDGGLIGFVDVPGHERFVHNMLAGVCGIDFALIVVAADDGVMPQTVEHLQILRLLGLDLGIAVITKVDRVDCDRVREVEAQVRALLAPTPLANCSILPVSSVTGTGIDRLRDALVRAAQTRNARYREGQNFRFAVDRSFTQSGSGTVVTGTVFNGEVGIGDRLVVSPSGISTRVRGIQIHGRATEHARAGDRCALNLAQIGVDAVTRGDWVLDEAIHAPSQRIEVRLTLLPSERAPLRHWTALHLHLATADMIARVATRRGTEILPGTTAWAQLVIDRPLAALNGDRFILRNQSANHTLGGGVVVDPFAPASRRGAVSRMAILDALAIGEPAAALAGMAGIPGHAIDCALFERTFNLSATRASTLYRSADLLVLGREHRLAIPRTCFKALSGDLIECVTAFHQRHPQAAGIEVRVLRRQLAAWLPPTAFGYLVKDLVESGRLSVDGLSVMVPGHDPLSNPVDHAMWQAVQPLLQQSGFTPPTVAEMARQLALDASLLADFLHRKSRRGELLRVAEDRYYPKATLATLAANAALVARGAPRGLFTAAQYRDAIGIGRNLAIIILEYFDTLGVTQRIGDLRRMHKNFTPILGKAKPALPPRPPAPRNGAMRPPPGKRPRQLRAQAR